jgi:hypothetical protein
MAREHHHALGHERGRPLEHRLAHRLDVPRLGVREDRDALAAVAAARLDDQLAEDVHRALEDLGPAEVEGLHRGQQRLLIQVEANHVLDVGVRQLVVGDAGAERVDDADAALAHQLEQQPADRRVDAVRVRAPVDDVDVVAHSQLLRLEQRDGERRGGPLVLVVGGVVLAVGEQRGAGAPVHGRGGCERAGQQRREPVERARGVRGRDVELRGERAPRGGGVGVAAGGAHVVLEHLEAPVRIAHEVEAGDADPDVAGRPQPLHRGLVVLGRVDHALRHHPRGDDPPVGVDVGDEAVEGTHALAQPGLDRVPLLRVEHPWDRVDQERLVAAGRVEADPLARDLLVDGGGERLEVAPRERAQRALVRRARPPVAVDRLVVAARLAAIVRQQVQWLLGDRHVPRVPDLDELGIPTWVGSLRADVVPHGRNASASHSTTPWGPRSGPP